MKKLVVGFMLAIVVMCLSCADIVIGDSPIVVVGDHMYVFLQKGDEFYATYNGQYGNMRVDRVYDDDAVIRYEESISPDLRMLVVTFPDAKVYPLILYDDTDQDNLRFSFRFENDVEWNLMGEATDDN